MLMYLVIDLCLCFRFQELQQAVTQDLSLIQVSLLKYH